MTAHKVVSQAEWLAARQELLVKEKEFSRLRHELSKRRQELPWQKVDKEYHFEGPDGKESLADLFAGRSQLIVYRFMFDPDWDEGCKSCSFIADHYNPSLVHLKHRDVTMVTVSRAPLPKLEAFRKRMGWSFKWVSSWGSDFNWDFQVSFKPEDVAKKQVYYNYKTQPFPVAEGPGISVFAKDEAGTTFHTYSSFGRGLDMFIGTYHLLDIVPKGRDEAGLPYGMAWVRHHDRYDDRSFVDPYVQLVAKRTK
jgi:predicted dithiol-disulfide oxidoreductase (DUF899 family)